MGNTFRLLTGGVDAVEGVFGHGRASAVFYFILATPEWPGSARLKSAVKRRTVTRRLALAAVAREVAAAAPDAAVAGMGCFSPMVTLRRLH
jgi:hypothetical protein